MGRHKHAWRLKVVEGVAEWFVEIHCRCGMIGSPDDYGKAPRWLRRRMSVN